MHKESRLANAALAFFSLLAVIFLLLPLSPLVNSARAVSGYVFLPFVESADSISEYMQGVPQNIAWLLRTEDENRFLRAKLKEAAVSEAGLSAALEENRRLSELLGFSAAAKWRGIWARVMARDSGRPYGSFLVDRGSKDGIPLHSPVLGAGAGGLSVVGKVIEVSRDSSKVLLLTDEMFSAAVYLSSGGYCGLAEGQSGGLVKLSYLPLSAEPSAGDVALTSPDSAVFPEGIPVGIVEKSLGKDEFGAYLSAELRPAANPASVKEVFIITGAGAKR